MTTASMPLDAASMTAKPLRRTYKHEDRLFWMCAIFSAACWLLLIGGTFGIGLLYIGIGFIIYLFAHSVLISYIKGSAARITTDQYPELYKAVQYCASKIGMQQVPDVYLMQSGGALNAFATRFLGKDFVVLYSDVVDALAENPGALNFYIGHELGHIARGHLKRMSFLLPSRLIPFLGAAYSRAREYTCDRYGFISCESPNDAVRALATLAVGGTLSSRLNTARYVEQARESRGFFMSFHEYLSPYPWLVKRVAAVMSYAQGTEPVQPSRHPVALGLAAISGFSLLIWIVAIVAFIAMSGGLKDIISNAVSGSGKAGTLGGPAAMIANPGTASPEAVNSRKSVIAAAIASVSPVKAMIEAHAVETGEWPVNGAAIGIPATHDSYSSDLQTVSVENGNIHLSFAPTSVVPGALISLSSDASGDPLKFTWSCSTPSLPQTFLPEGCMSAIDSE